MSRKANQNKAEAEPDTAANEAAVPPVGQNADEAKDQQNDQTGNEPGLANALLDQVEGRKDAQLAQEDGAPDAGNGEEEPLNPEGKLDPSVGPTHQEISDSVADEATRDALRVQAERADQVKNAFVREIRAETLDAHSPQRVENVRVLVESNDHLDRSGDNVHESEAGKIVMSDGVDEARMIDVQPEGEIDSEFDLGSGIRQTNLK